MKAATLLALLPYLVLVYAAPAKRCTATISSYSDLAAAVSSKCTTINVQAFTVPAGETFDLSNLASGTTVNIQGEVTFAGLEGGWAGPLFSLSGSSITLNGNGNTFNGNGQVYWDGYGSNSKTNVKPKFMHIGNSGTIQDLTLLNTPVQAFSISASNLVVDNVTINNKAGYAIGSNGLPLAHNTDCFDVEGTGVTVQNSFCYNQDDCLAINKGTDIHFLNNYCSGGHGISIGANCQSIASGAVVKGVTVTGNTVVDSMNGLRIKTIAGATGGSVSDVTYTSNTVSGISQYGVDVQQDYENGSPTGSPTNGIIISDIDFPSGNTVSVNSGAKEVYVLCGSGSCQGTWDWSGLKTSGGSPGSISPSNVPITGYALA